MIPIMTRSSGIFAMIVFMVAMTAIIGCADQDKMVKKEGMMQKEGMMKKEGTMQKEGS